MHCKRSNNEGTYHLKENGVLVTDKRKVAEIDLQQLFFSYSIQNVGEEHDSDSNVAVDIIYCSPKHCCYKRRQCGCSV